MLWQDYIRYMFLWKKEWIPVILWVTQANGNGRWDKEWILWILCHHIRWLLMLVVYEKEHIIAGWQGEPVNTVSEAREGCHHQMV
jgi:hypothetical protein